MVKKNKLRRKNRSTATSGRQGADTASVEDPSESTGPARQPVVAASARRSSEREWFRFYKPTQGYWTRLCTAVGGGVFVAWGASFLFNQLSVYQNTTYGDYIRVAIPLIWMVALGYLLYWLVGKNPKCCDFLISVEGEMKKVSWSTRSEVFGATRVVILFVVLISVMLFVVDTIFMTFFSSIGVLKIGGIGDVVRKFLGL